MRLSGWCSGPEGCTSPRAHRTCDERIRKGLITRCGCEAFGGHNHDDNEEGAA